MNSASPPPPASTGPQLDTLLRRLYGGRLDEQLQRDFNTLAARPTNSGKGTAAGDLTERDALLITYADQVSAPHEAPLQTLAAFCRRHLTEVVSGIHILPFFPWSSDDGFSVKDYFAVEPAYGTWADIDTLGQTFDLMFDAVFNHMSAESGWFQRFLNDEPEFRDFFVTVKGRPDLSQVVRPRALPLLTEFPTARGPEQVWTTFSADQVDVNAKNPRLLLALLQALLTYVRHGARFIRLDAIAYLWKENGTPCIHLPQTHAVIQLMRAVLDQAAPHVQLITETNVPHADNLSYFGDGTNEAQLVYNFALPPLVLHTLLRGNATQLTHWAATLKAPSRRTTFFNFLASHDGIGLNPARGILSPAEIDHLVACCLAHGGFINYKHNADGSKSPYEMNIVYFDALSDPTAGEPVATQVNRFLVAQAIMLALAGVPGIYFHSLFGSRNDRAAALTTGINRRINRQKLTLAELEPALAGGDPVRASVFARYRTLLQARRQQAAFNPHGNQQVLGEDPRAFCVLRTATTGRDWMLCLHNVTNEVVRLAITTAGSAPTERWTEIWQQNSPAISTTPAVTVTLPPYAVHWLHAQGAPPLAIKATD